MILSPRKKKKKKDKIIVVCPKLAKLISKIIKRNINLKLIQVYHQKKIQLNQPYQIYLDQIIQLSPNHQIYLIYLIYQISQVRIQI